MPHISDKKLNNKILKQIDDQLIKFFNKKENTDFIINNLLTATERLMLAKRLAMLLLLYKGLMPYDISKILKVSPSTVGRFSKQLEGQEFKKIEKKVNNVSSDLVEYLLGILLVPFDRPYKGVSYRKRR